MVLGAVACWFVFVLASVLVGGAVVVRTATAIVNRILGARRQADDELDLDEWIGYRQIKRTVAPIPEPDVWKGATSVLLVAVINFLAGVALREIFGVGPFDEPRQRDDSSVVFWHVMGVLLSFPLGAWVVMSVLPTNFGRACLVLLWCYLIPLILALGIAWIVALVA